ncbi:hypothetical protein NL108_017695 [Boleophthalmus pectinirostris]|nr:hypothetical protein NL108_017695 [Boleophthalmus pectinirostris]
MLYKTFNKKKIKDTETKYKRYKNVLTIIQACKKENFAKQLELNRNNVKGIWKLINEILSNKPKSNNYRKYFIHDNKDVNNMNEAADDFNLFFGNVGPELTGKMSSPCLVESEQLIQRNPNSLFSLWMKLK